MRSSEMKKFLLALVGLVVFVGVLLFANDWGCRQIIFASTGSVPYKMYRLFDERPKGEIAIIGSSRAQGHYVPSVLGENVFNYGIDGTTMYETVLHLHALIARHDTAPIIVNLDPWGVAGDTLRGDYSLVTKHSDVLTAEDKIVPRTHAGQIIRFWGKFRTIWTVGLNSLVGGTKHINRGAVLQRISRNESEWRHIIKGLVPARFGIDSNVYADLEHLLNVPHPPVYVVLSPISKPWYEKFAAEGKNLVGLNALLERLRQCPNTRVIDLLSQNLENYPLSEFFDPTHLNEHGAIKFSAELKSILKDSGF